MMKRIKKAKNQGKDQHIIEQRTNELYNYLEREGLVDRFPDE